MPSTLATSITALLHGPDKPGIVAKAATWIYERGGNILHADQHNDAQHQIFFQRLEWQTGHAYPAEEAAEFAAFASSLGMSVGTLLSTDRPKVAIFVSQHLHAAHELLLDWQQGDLPCQIAGVISNHDGFRSAAEAAGLPFHCLPASSGGDKKALEAEQLRLLRFMGADLAVLARYMQILSADFLAAFGRPVINIHHSFLPAFAGAKPYHQAHRRGVKVIGATAHYVTPVLDDGPIICQDVRRVSHRDTVGDLLRKGRDLEKLVLSEAVRLHLQSRVLVYENKTVVFD